MHARFGTLARSAASILVTGGVTLGAGVARAQTTIDTLDESGEWVSVRTPEPGSDEEIIARARRLLAEGQAGQARSLMNDWIGEHKETDTPWLPEAYLVRGDARTATGREYWALYDYEEICKNYPQTDVFPRAVEREFEIGKRYLNGLRTKIFWVRLEDATPIGEELMLRVAERMPGSQIAEKAVLELADYYYRTRQLDAASEAYDVFLTKFPRSEFRQKAMQRRVYASIAKFKGPKYDASGLTEARYLIRAFADRYPAEAERSGMNDALAARLDESAAEQMYEVAGYYLRRGDEVSARFTLQRLQRKHPETVAASRGRDLMAERGWLTTPPSARPQTEPRATPETPPEGEKDGDRAPTDPEPTPPTPEAER